MNVRIIPELSEFQKLNGSLIKSLFKLEENFHNEYHEDHLTFDKWKSIMIERFKEGVKYIIAEENNKVTGYSAIVEDLKYENFYCKNFTVDSSKGFNTIAYRLIVTETLSLFLASDFNLIRFSTNKLNTEVNNTYEKMGLLKKESHLNSDHYIYEISKDNIENLAFYRIYKRMKKYSD
ncbi:hypothetical protein [Virgibacillus halodenitrificans]|uniref:hypothetical protein n=1 Tax=Virgibacillus halodenitrificans TaxID=1482 RepID=UPI000EF520B9|nr:hypothetical protein [Virgibacillus halodenitrificans]